MNNINQKKFLQIKYWIYAISALLIIRILFNSFESILSYEDFFVDHAVYNRAVKEFIAGGKPYGVGFPIFPFQYPPFVLIFFSFFKEFLTPFLLFIYLLVLLSFCLFFRKEPKVFIYSILISIALLEIRGASILSAILTGNIGFFLHLAIITLWLFRNNFNTKIALYIAIIIGVMFKPPVYLLYLLLPLLADAKISVSKIIPGLITIIAVILIYVLQMVMLPELFSNFISGLKSHEFGSEKVSMSGWSIISIWIHISNSYVVAIFGYIITNVLIIASWVYYKRRYLDKIENTDFVRQCASIMPVVICIVIMPRLILYDYAIMNFLLIYFLLKIKVFDINYNFIFKSKISLLGITAIFIWTIQWILYFFRFIQPDEMLSSIIGVSSFIGIYSPIFLVIIIALVDRSKKIRLGTWPK